MKFLILPFLHSFKLGRNDLGFQTRLINGLEIFLGCQVHQNGVLLNELVQSFRQLAAPKCIQVFSTVGLKFGSISSR